MGIKAQLGETAQSLANVTSVKAQDLEKILGWWVRHSPPDYYEDSLQEYGAAILQMDAPVNAAKVYRTVKDTASLIWKRWHVRQHLSLDGGRDGDAGEPARMADYLVDAVDYERVAVGNVEAARIWAELPVYIRRLVSLKLQGQRIGGQAQVLKRWAQSHGQPILAEYMAS